MAKGRNLMLKGYVLGEPHDHGSVGVSGVSSVITAVSSSSEEESSSPRWRRSCLTTSRAMARRSSSVFAMLCQLLRASLRDEGLFGGILRHGNEYMPSMEVKSEIP